MQSAKMVETDKWSFENCNRTSTNPVFYVVDKGYYIILNTVDSLQRAFIKPSSNTAPAIGSSKTNGWVALVHRTAGDESEDSSQSVGNAGGADLTKMEFQNILDSKPSLESLAKVYCLKVNRNVTMPIADQAIPVF
jgi:hypothetical protein